MVNFRGCERFPTSSNTPPEQGAGSGELPKGLTEAPKSSPPSLNAGPSTRDRPGTWASLTPDPEHLTKGPSAGQLQRQPWSFSLGEQKSKPLTLSPRYKEKPSASAGCMAEQVRACRRQQWAGRARRFESKAGSDPRWGAGGPPGPSQPRARLQPVPRLLRYHPTLATSLDPCPGPRAQHSPVPRTEGPRPASARLRQRIRSTQKGRWATQ